MANTLRYCGPTRNQLQVARHPLSAHIRPILAGWGRPAVPVSAVTTGRRYRPPKTEAFIALARRDFAQGLWG